MNNKNLAVGVVGLGYVGEPLFNELINNNFKVYGFDSNSRVLSRVEGTLKRIKKLSSSIILSTKYDSLINCDVILICLPTPLNSRRLPDTSIIDNFFKNAQTNFRSGSLIILESTVQTGYCRKLFVNIGQKLKNDFGVEVEFAFSPERIDPLNRDFHLVNTPKLVSGLTENSKSRAINFYSEFINEVIECSSLEVAETAKLLENSFRYINISFINEFAIFCNKIGLDPNSVIAASSTKPYGFMKFNPSIGAGGHCIPVDPIYLNEKAIAVGTPMKFIELADKVNRRLPKYFAQRAKKMLGKIRGTRILIIGVAYKPNIADVRESPAKALVDLLRKQGANVKWHDDLVKEWRGEKSVKISNNYDLAIIVTPHNYINFSELDSMKTIDTRFLMPSLLP